MNYHIKRPVLENNLFMSLQFVIAQQPLADFQHVALTKKSNVSSLIQIFKSEHKTNLITHN